MAAAGASYARNRAMMGVLVPVLFLVLLVVAFTLLNDRFLSWVNLFNLMRQSSILLLVATGTTFVILMGAIDLSIGSIVTLVAITAALLLRDSGLGAAEVLLIGAAIGAACGLINGALVVYARVPAFVATLSTMIVFGGVSTWVAGGANVTFRNADMTWLASGKLIGQIPNSGLWALAIFAVAAFVGARSIFGRALYAIGAGETTARLSGINVPRTQMVAFVVSGVLCALAGLMLVARTSTGTARMGDDLLLEAIAAVVMGGTALSGGAGGVHRTILGVLVISVLKNGLNVAGVHPYVQICITGLIVIIAVTLTLDRSRLAFVK
jgi:Ribose/xylose/arabinose/galactoside ABC-type transport systems, permease components